MNLILLNRNQLSRILRFGKIIRVLGINTIHTKWDNQCNINIFYMYTSNYGSYTNPSKLVCKITKHMHDGLFPKEGAINLKLITMFINRRLWKVSK